MMFSDGLDMSIENKEDNNNIFNRLEQKNTEILILKYYVDLTLQQITGILGLNISNTKVRLHRAKGNSGS
ncbi:sigma factor-like helix-turn-helix DNA-binding protein [Desulfosporosinus sp. SYSU MS00001]|uniref:sigma factor-like helix-turn-helix DNA-binding protein n=1 Tax=Desulfosporosinus sp. SYSU MS00001 TaxID=3416284 RepID=UPI003CF63A5D